MNLDRLNKMCFMVCIVCIVLGAALSLVMIWSEIRDNDFLWKSLLSLGVLFLAAAVTLSVSKTLGGKPRDEA